MRACVRVSVRENERASRQESEQTGERDASTIKATNVYKHR